MAKTATRGDAGVRDLASSHRAVGEGTPRIDAVANVTGASRFGADYTLPGTLWTRILRSPHAHARITRLDVSKALAHPGVRAVGTAADLPAKREATSRTHTVFADGFVLFVGQPVAAVAAIAEADAEEAVRLIEVEYVPLPAVLDALEAMKPGAPLIRHSTEAVDRSEQRLHTDVGSEAEHETQGGNVSSEVHFDRGDAEKGFAEADVIAEGAFHSAVVHQSYLEPHAALASWDPSGKLTVWCSTQGQFWLRDAIAGIVDVPPSRVKVIGTAIGGGFGGKLGDLVAHIAAILARKAGAPVKTVISRSEELGGGAPAPASVIEIKIGAKRDGTMTALRGRVVMDSGAFPGAPMSIATVLLGAVYEIPNYKLDGYEVLTNKPSVTSYRAPGAPNSAFALEAAVEELARKLDMDPIKLRLKNAIDEGGKWPNGQPLGPIGLKKCLEAIRDHEYYSLRSAGPENGKLRGWGVATGGWPGGSGPAAAEARLDPDGSARILVGAINLTGTSTSFVQIAAEELCLPLDRVKLVEGDTDEAPFAPVSGGSQITYAVGTAVRRAAAGLMEKMRAAAAQKLEVSPEVLEAEDGVFRVKGDPEKKLGFKRVYDAALAAGGPLEATGSKPRLPTAPAYVATYAEVLVDPETGNVDLVKLLAVQDVGFAINPMSVDGQMQGGAIQGFGYAVTEELKFDAQGKALNVGFLDYRLPTALDVPMVATTIVEVPNEHGPYGARIVGEPPIVTPGAAISNAIARALGKTVRWQPMDPERVVALAREKVK